jgi:hypothetical protein
MAFGDHFHVPFHSFILFHSLLHLLEGHPCVRIPSTIHKLAFSPFGVRRFIAAFRGKKTRTPLPCPSTQKAAMNRRTPKTLEGGRVRHRTVALGRRKPSTSHCSSSPPPFISLVHFQLFAQKSHTQLHREASIHQVQTLGLVPY